MNPKLQASGRRGGMAGKGASKVRPLSRPDAQAMAWLRWQKSKPSQAMQGHVLSCRCDDCENLRKDNQ